jgi:hypothetical protein
VVRDAPAILDVLLHLEDRLLVRRREVAERRVDLGRGTQKRMLVVQKLRLAEVGAIIDSDQFQVPFQLDSRRDVFLVEAELRQMLDDLDLGSRQAADVFERFEVGSFPRRWVVRIEDARGGPDDLVREFV